MSGGVVVLVNLIVAAVLLAAAISYPSWRSVSRRTLSLATLPLAALPLVAASLFSVFVVGEDSYRENGISRWDAYRSPGGALGPMFVLSVTFMATCAAVIVFAGRRGRVGLLCGTAVVGGLTSLVLLTATAIGFTVN